MTPQPALTTPSGALGDVRRADSETTSAINISASSSAPPGLDSSPISKDVITLKGQVEFLYQKQQECMLALNQVAIEQRGAVSETNGLVSTLHQTVSAIKTQQDGMDVSEKSLWEGIRETRQVLETSAVQLRKTTSDIQEEAIRTKHDVASVMNQTATNIREETQRTMQDIAAMWGMFPDQTNAIANHMDKIPDDNAKEEGKNDPNTHHGRQSLRSPDGIRDWRYQLPENCDWSPNAREPMGPSKFPTLRNRNVPANPTISLAISDRPKFDVDRFESYRRDLFRGGVLVPPCMIQL